MKLEKGKFYELKSDTDVSILCSDGDVFVDHYTGFTVYGTHLVNSSHVTYNPLNYKVVNTFNDIHEVSERIKEIEAEKEKELENTMLGNQVLKYQLEEEKEKYLRLAKSHKTKVKKLKSRIKQLEKVNHDLKERFNFISLEVLKSDPVKQIEDYEKDK